MIVALAFLLAAAMAFLPIEAILPLARILVPGIALIATGIFPSMTLTVGAMQVGEQNPSLVEKRYQELKKLLKVLAATFGLSVASIMFLSIAVSIKGNSKFIPLVEAYGPHVAMALFGFVVVLLLGRGKAVITIYFHILDLNKKQALLNSRKRVDAFFSGAENKSKLDVKIKRPKRPQKLDENSLS